MADESFLQKPPKFHVSTWLPVARESWRGDIIAGLTLWGLVVPESIAYAGLAGVPASSGIWAVVLILPIYAFWGRSRHLIASPTSAASVTMGGIVSQIDGAEPVHIAAAISMTAGLCYLLVYLFRLGFFVNFISQPINAGFMFGLALFITVSQLNKVLGLESTDGNAIERLIAILGELGEVNPATLALSALGAAIFLVVPRLSSKAPVGLIMIAVLGLLVWIFDLGERFDVETAGSIPSELPSVVAPDIALADWGLVIAGAIGIVLLGFSEASSVGRDVAEKHGYPYKSQKDLWPFGLGNLASGLFGGLVGAGSMSSTSANTAAGARTPISSLTAAALALATVLLFGDAFSTLPEAALGVLIIHAVSRHFNISFSKTIARFSPNEAVIAWIAAGGVLVFDVLWGLLIAMACSIAWFLKRSTSIAYWRVGPSAESSGTLVHADRSQYQALPEGYFAVRFQGDLFYGNVDDAIDVLDGLVNEHKPHTLVIDLEAQRFVDYTTAVQLRRFIGSVSKDGVSLLLVGINGDLADALHSADALPDNVEIRGSTDLTDLLE